MLRLAADLGSWRARVRRRRRERGRERVVAPDHLLRVLLRARAAPPLQTAYMHFVHVTAHMHVHVTAHAVALTPNHEQALGVRLERGHAVDDVHARLLQLARPRNVRALVETCLELDQADRLLAALGRADQSRHERRVMRLIPRRPHLVWEGRDELVLSFELPKGAYATTLLRELAEINSAELGTGE